MKEILKELHKIKAFAFDVDGVFTDGAVMLHPGGEFIRMMNIKDGFAVQHAVKMGYPIAVITGGQSKTVKQRFSVLGVKAIYMKSANKMEAYRRFLKKYHLNPSEVLYMGDDLPDFEVMKQTGFSACPADATEEIKQLSGYVSPFGGGRGCVRDIIEKVMKIQGKWMNDFSFIW